MTDDTCIEELLELRDDNERLRHLAARFLLELSQERVKLADKIVESEAMRHTLKALYFDSISNYHNEQTINTVKMLLGLQEAPKTL